MTKRTHVIEIGLGALLSLSLLGLQAQAGDRLLLKAAGTLRVQDASEKMLTHALGAAGETEGVFVIQFQGKITEASKQALAARGLHVLRYLPEDALIVRGPEREAVLAKSALTGARAVLPYEAQWKLSPDLASGPAPQAASVESFVVSAFDDESADRLRTELASLPGVAVRGTEATSRDLVVDASRARLSAIAELQGIEWIERMPLWVEFTLAFDERDNPTPSPSPSAHPDYNGYESGTKVMNFDAAWSRGFEGEGQILAVADTGLDTGDVTTIHPDFQGNLLKGYNAGLGTESWEDPMGHGTHVAGSMVGNGTASGGHIRGGAHKGKIIMEGLWSAILDNLAPGTDFNKLFGTVFADGARVHSNSWGNPANPGDYDTFASRVDEYMWNNPDLLVLFAAGNDGADKNHDGRIDEGSVSSPATAKNVLTVGASENLFSAGGIQKKLSALKGGQDKWGVEPLASDTLSNNPDGIACFSSRGPTSDGRTKPEIVAPGTNIISVHSRVPGASLLWGAYDDNYVYAGGTSMATPLTAGAAAVTREYLVKAKGIDNPSAALLKATMVHTAHDLYPGQYGTGPTQELPTRRPNNHEGYGRVDMDAATSIPASAQFVDDRAGVGTGEAKSVHVAVGASGSLRATMSYTDAPAAASAAKALVNDIDLSVTGPDGHVYTNNDHVNNTEMLELSGLAAGEYTVTVSGVNVPQGKQGKQPYALVVQ